MPETADTAKGHPDWFVELTQRGIAYFAFPFRLHRGKVKAPADGSGYESHYLHW